ncbi:unnamed protein product [Rangifer tarandus platyrhynchus]|uniref:Uncharacterized protein n=1 Tax=Rangifer tarandus platyrhynchus TaxID=3082113 RepID=A0ABN9A1G5_RANTA|nr:unnamed protein product [Rangifer tarandus platyrhynchus]
MDCCSPGLSANGISQAGILEGAAMRFLQGIFPTPGIQPRSPALQVDSLPADPPGKTRNTGVGSLSLLQGIFPTQESNHGSPAVQADSLPAELPLVGIRGGCQKKK